MYANYHTHTKRCKHAKGEDRDYVEKAIEAGVKILGFSDHSPMLFDSNYYSGFRMFPEQTEDYVNSVLSLRDKYKDDIEILCGFEMEYYPRYFEKTIRFLDDFDYDYLILGQHFVGNEPDAYYSGVATEDENILISYVDQVIEGLSTERFAYLAHPDLINYTGDEAIYRREMTRLCVYAKEHDIPLEFNFLGYYTGRSYPRQSFRELCAENGNRMIFGADAHEPEVFIHPKLEGIYNDYSNLPGIIRVDELERKRFR